MCEGNSKEPATRTVRVSPGGPVKTGDEDVKVMLLLKFSFGLLSAISSSVPQ